MEFEDPQENLTILRSFIKETQIDFQGEINFPAFHLLQLEYSKKSLASVMTNPNPNSVVRSRASMYLFLQSRVGKLLLAGDVETMAVLVCALMGINALMTSQGCQPRHVSLGGMKSCICLASCRISDAALENSVARLCDIIRKLLNSFKFC